MGENQTLLPKGPTGIDLINFLSAVMTSKKFNEAT